MSVNVAFLVLFAVQLANCCDVFTKINVTLYDDPLSVETIKVKDTKIPNLCRNAIRNLENLHTIHLISNEIQSIEPGAFKNIPLIRNIVIKNNNISSIADGVFNNLNMRKLDLSANGISKIGANAFNYMPNLEVLILDRNRIKSLSARWFRNTPMFYRLSMIDNAINVIPERAFAALSDGTSRPRDLDIWLSKNVIAEVQANAFENIERIDTLWLDDNALTENLLDAIAHIKIQNLHLNKNRFKCIDDKTMKKLKIYEFSIDDNPLDCGCLKNMKRAAKSKQMDFSALKTGLECLKTKIKKLSNDSR